MANEGARMFGTCSVSRRRVLIGLAASLLVDLRLAGSPPQEMPSAPRGVQRTQPPVSAPHLVSKVEPEYTDEARRAGVNSMVLLYVVVRENGLPSDLRVVRGAGFGLDEMAIAAVQLWQFDPGTKEGRPVPVAAQIEVNFRLLNRDSSDQIARLNFTPSSGLVLPELKKGKIPKNPNIPGDQTVRIRLRVDEKGEVESTAVVSATNDAWAEKVQKEVRSWKFHPAIANGQATAVDGVFQLTHGNERRQYSDQRRP